MNKNAVGLVALAMLLVGVLLGVSLMVMRGFLPGRSMPSGVESTAEDPSNTARIRDDADLDGFTTILSGLETFRTRNNSYPDTLEDLVASDIMNAVPRERSKSGVWKEYRYVPWVEKQHPGLCSARGTPNCLGYHLGVSLEDTKQLLLLVDADADDMTRGKNFSGSDEYGCFHEEGMSCFDVTAARPFAEAENALTIERAKNTTYQVGETFFTLIAGVESRRIAPNSALMETVRIVHGPVAGDLNGDRIPDAALGLSYEAGGSGTFLSLAAALTVPDGTSLGTPSVALGDRITIRSIVIERGVITVELFVREGTDPLSAPPTVPETRRFILVGGSLVEQIAK